MSIVSWAKITGHAMNIIIEVIFLLKFNNNKIQMLW